MGGDGEGMRSARLRTQAKSCRTRASLLTTHSYTSPCGGMPSVTTRWAGFRCAPYFIFAPFPLLSCLAPLCGVS
eukprot:350796-Chlamydomonas_euryale.AAC.6